MGKFLELRYGRGDLGRSICNRMDVEEGEFFIQKRIVPVDAIKDVSIILPRKRNISITVDLGGKLFTFVEYYKNEIDCIKRWTMIRRACGITVAEVTLNPVPLPMDAEEWEEIKEDNKK